MNPPPALGAPPGSGVLAWFLRNRVAANLLLLGISLAGLLTLGGIPQEIVPTTQAAALAVRVAFPGAGAEQVESSVLLHLEEAVRDVSGVKETTAVATEGLGMLTVAVESWADFDGVARDIREQVESLTTLPANAEQPVVSEVVPERQLLRLAVHGEADERSLSEAAHRVREAVAAIPGVASARISTGREYEISIEIPRDILSRFGLTFDQVAAAIRRGSVDIPGGAVRSDRGDLRLATENRALTAAEFAAIPLIAAPGGGLVTVGDVATVTDGFSEAERSARMDGAPAVLLELTLADGARLLDTAEAVREEIRAVEAALPEGISVRSWYDAWELFNNRIEVLVVNGLQGLALIFLVLFFTLSTRLAVWTAAGLPVAFFGAFLMMPGLGVTMNMFSLFGFILTLGVVVDDAIVVGENVQRHVAAGTAADTEASALRGTREVLLPAGFGVLTTMAAFAPLLGIPGTWGEIIGTIPRIAIPVLAFSLIEAAWILPHHLAHGGLPVRPSPRLARLRAGFQHGLDWTRDRLYRPALAWSLDNRLATLALGVLSLAVTLGLLGGGWIRVDTNPPLESDVVSVQVSLPPGSSVRATGEVVAAVEAAITQIREEIQRDHGVDVQRALSVLVGQRLPLGAGAEFGGQAGRADPTLGQIIFELISPGERAGFTTRDIAARLEARTAELPHGGEATILTSLVGREGDISIRVSGTELDRIRLGAEAVAARFREFRGILSVADDWEGGVPQLVARARADGAGIGIGPVDFGRQLRQAFHGEEVQRLQRGREELRVMLRHPQDERSRRDDVTEMRVRRGDGAVAPFGEVADIAPRDTAGVIRRVNERRAITVHATVDPDATSTGAVQAELQRRGIHDLREQFPDLRFDFAGAASEFDETIEALGRNLVLAMILVYGLLAVPLSSWTQPFIIMAAIPFGLAGAIFGHLVLGVPFSLISFAGMVPLVGIVVNDALVLMDFINRKRAEGMPTSEAVLAAGPLRYRPIILTSLTTCAGVTPLLTAQNVQAQALVPMATSLAFGVAFATLVTLFIVPAIYSLSDDALRLLRRTP